MSALEKFKRRLVRDIARRQYLEDQLEDEMWDQLKTEYGCDCFLLWQHMKVLTSKKLKRMLAAEDRMESITRVAQMTSTDWLTFDLVLVHQDVDVIGEELIQSGKQESPVLEELFALVKKYNIEDFSGDRLTAKWIALTVRYNSRGRACSAMLLQRRWYQLKDLSRRRIYEFWKHYRGNPKNLPKAVRPTKFQIEIAHCFPNLITETFEQWKNLIDLGKVVEAVEFENRRRKKESNGDDPDLVVIEPHVETIEVAADSEDEDGLINVMRHVKNKQIKQGSTCLSPENSLVTNKNIDEAVENIDEAVEIVENVDNVVEAVENVNQADCNVDSSSNSIMTYNGVKVPVKSEPMEVVETNDTLSDDEPMETDATEVIGENYTPEQVENDLMLPENDIVLPKITNIMGSVDIKANDKYNTGDETVPPEVPSNSDDPSAKTDAPSKITTDVTEENAEKNYPINSNDLIDLKELPPTLQFVDDGIEFLDDDEDERPDVNDGNKIVNLDEVDPSYGIDRKLVMIPITYTKKLDDIDVLKNIDYSSLKGNAIIKLVEADSRIIKRVDIKTEVETEHEHTDETGIDNDSEVTNKNKEVDEARIQEQSSDNDDDENINRAGSQDKRKEAESKNEIKVKTEKEKISGKRTEDDSEECEVPRVKYTSWLLQKPRHRNYNPILLCKNPDFNRRLKRLSVGFFLSERNRRLFNACKPLTIDMHKAFETKLVSNVLYLENTTIPNIKQEKVTEICEKTISVIPTAVAVQSLLDITVRENEDLSAEKLESQEVSKPSPDLERDEKIVIKRGHVINVPSEACRVDDKLSACRSPVGPTPVADSEVPVQSFDGASITRHNATSEKKNKKAKTKLLPSVAGWITPWHNVVHYEESLIAKDTLDKMIQLLDKDLFLLSNKKVNADATKNRPTTKESIPHPPIKKANILQEKVNRVYPDGPKERSTTKVAIPRLPAKKAKCVQGKVNKSGDIVNLTADEGEIKSDKNLISRNSKRIRNGNQQTIAYSSGFCCWSRYKIEYLRPENQKVTYVKYKKFKHLCSYAKNDCYCCCRQDLLETLKLMDPSYSRDAVALRNKERETANTNQFRDVAIQAKSVPNRYGHMEINSFVEFHHPNNKEEGTGILDAVTKYSNDSTSSSNGVRRKSQEHSHLTDAVHQSSVSTQFENNEVATKFKNACDLLSDLSSQTPHADIPPLIKINVIPATLQRGNSLEVYAVTAADSRHPPKRSTTNRNKAVQREVVETISLIDDDVNSSPHQAPKILLPEGVKLVLLPNNTLSVSIDPGVQIDPTSLSQLPEILSAVYNKLSKSGMLTPRKCPIRKWKYSVNSSKGNISTSKNTVVNQPRIINLDPEINMVNENIELSARNPGENDAQINIVNTEIDVTENNAKFGFIGPERQYTSELNDRNEHVELNLVSPKKLVIEENAELNLVSPKKLVITENAELNLVSPKKLVIEENAELNLVSPKKLVIEENAELNLVSPNKLVIEENAELNLVSPEDLIATKNIEQNSVFFDLPVTEETAEITVINPIVPVAEENAKLVINTEVKDAEENVENNVINTEQRINARNAELSVMNSELICTQGSLVPSVVNTVLNAPRESAVLNVVNAQLCASQDNVGPNETNTNPVIGTPQTPSVLYVSGSHLDTNIENTLKNVAMDAQNTLTYKDFVIKVAPETKRKTILSDLMTLSGISPEDTNTPTESSATVINYNLPDNPYYLTNTHNVRGNIHIAPPPKKVKKVMVFIKKKCKNKPLVNNSVIDLTEDNDNTADTSEQNGPQPNDTAKREPDIKKMMNLNKAKLIRVPAAAVPPKIYQVAQSLLRRDNAAPVQNKTALSSKDIEKQMKIHVARHYRQLNKKPTILDILKNMKNSKALQEQESPNVGTESESSDDEPLAKKSRRMRSENTDRYDTLNVVPVEQYEVPVEYDTDEPAIFPPTDDQNTDVEENAILGI